MYYVDLPNFGGITPSAVLDPLSMILSVYRYNEFILLTVCSMHCAVLKLISPKIYVTYKYRETGVLTKATVMEQMLSNQNLDVY